jgi:hypothetical protein
MAPNDPVTLDLDGHALTLELYDAKAPKACAVMRERLPLEGEIVHAMWSGPLCLVNDLNRDVPLENPTKFLAPGDVIYHPVHHEIGFAYGTTQFREPTGSVYVSFIGRIADDLTPLVAIGENLQRSGAVPVVLSRAGQP